MLGNGASSCTGICISCYNERQWATLSSPEVHWAIASYIELFFQSLNRVQELLFFTLVFGDENKNWFFSSILCFKEWIGINFSDLAREPWCWIQCNGCIVHLYEADSDGKLQPTFVSHWYKPFWCFLSVRVEIQSHRGCIGFAFLARPIFNSSCSFVFLQTSISCQRSMKRAADTKQTADNKIPKWNPILTGQNTAYM